MARPASPIIKRRITVALPEDLMQAVDSHLYSALEEKVPYGAVPEFLTQLLHDFFAKAATSGESDVEN